MEHLKYWKAEDVKEAYKQSLIALAKDRKKQFVSMSRLNLFEDHPRDASFYSEEDDSKVLDYKDAHLGFDPEKYPKLNNRLSNKEKLQDDCDIQATNIVLQGLPSDVYSLVNHHTVAKELWDRIKLLIQVIKLSLQEHECKLYNKFDQFTSEKGESLHFRKWAPDEWYYEGEMEHLKYWKAEDEKKAYKQRLIDLAKDRKKQFVSMPRLTLFENHPHDASFYSEEDDFEVFDYKDAHLGFDPEKYTKLNNRCKERGRMFLDSVLHGTLNYGTIEVDCVPRTKTYEELSDKEKLQDDCDIRATNIVLQDLPSDSHMILYIKGKEHGRMILDSVLYGPLNYGTIEMDCVTKTRTYEEISKKENLQDDCDIPATNILHQGLPPHVYSLLNHHTVANEI
ncbi:hypothetical protein Tco_1035218 [Tanacetum coccineum]